MNAVTLKDKKLFEKFLLKSELWFDNFFYYLSDKLKWEIIEDCLCVFSETTFSPEPGLKLFRLPFGDKRNILKAIRKCIKEKGVSRILFATEEDLKLLPNYYSFEVGLDFICNTKHIINMDGPKLRTTRKEIRRFQKLFDYKIYLYNRSADLKDYLELLDLWYKNRGLEKGAWDYIYTRESFEYLDQLDNVKAITLRVDGKLIGFYTGCVLTKNMWVGFSLKTNPDFQKYGGASDLLFQEIATLFQRCLFVNLGGHAKSEGLKRYKMKFSPVKINKIYGVKLNKIKPAFLKKGSDID